MKLNDLHHQPDKIGSKAVSFKQLTAVADLDDGAPPRLLGKALLMSAAAKGASKAAIVNTILPAAPNRNEGPHRVAFCFQTDKNEQQKSAACLGNCRKGEQCAELFRVFEKCDQVGVFFFYYFICFACFSIARESERTLHKCINNKIYKKKKYIYVYCSRSWTKG
jgi:hypothetical protein